MFSKPSFLAISIMLFLAVFVRTTHGGVDSIWGKGDDPLGIIVPFDFTVCDTYGQGLRDLRRLHDEFGVRRVLITGCPGLGVRLSGWEKELSRYEKFGDLLARIKQDLSDIDLQIGWWNGPSQTCSKGAPFRFMVGGDGRVSERTCCPLDKGYVADLAMRIAEVAKRGRPAFILFEDDLHFGSKQAGPSLSCYCPLHIKALSERCGRSFTREEVYRICCNPTAENRDIRTAFTRLLCDSICELGSAIRAEVDKVSPSTRMGLCLGYDLARDGGMNYEFPRVVAGPGRPFVRVPTSVYASDASYQRLIQIFGYGAYYFEHMPDGFEAVQEVDSYPHNRFFTPDSFMDTLHVLGIIHGSNGTLYYGTQYLDSPLEQDGYFGVLKKRRRFLVALRSAVSGKSLVGVQTMHVVDLSNVHRYLSPQGPSWGGLMLSRFGIPHTTREQPVKLLIGNESRKLTTAAARAMLEKGGLMLDSSAAADLSARGLNNFLGACIAQTNTLPAIAERILPAADTGRIEGRRVYNFAFAPASKSQVCAFGHIDGLSPEATVLSEFLDAYGNVVSPSAYRFTNPSGGRIVVVAVTLAENRSESVFNFRKREMFRKSFEWLGGVPLPVSVADEANIGVWLNVSADGGEFLLTVVNFRPDVVVDPKFFLSDVLRRRKISELHEDGEWHPGCLDGEYHPCVARVFRFSR